MNSPGSDHYSFFVGSFAPRQTLRREWPTLRRPSRRLTAGCLALAASSLLCSWQLQSFAWTGFGVFAILSLLARRSGICWEKTPLLEGLLGSARLLVVFGALALDAWLFLSS